MLGVIKLPRCTVLRDYGRLIRVVTGESVTDFSKRLGVTPSMVSSFEVGRTYSSNMMKLYEQESSKLCIDSIYDEVVKIRRDNSIDVKE